MFHTQTLFEITVTKDKKSPPITIIKTEYDDFCRVLRFTNSPGMSWLKKKVGPSLAKHMHPCPYEVISKKSLRSCNSCFCLLTERHWFLKHHDQVSNWCIFSSWNVQDILSIRKRWRRNLLGVWFVRKDLLSTKRLNLLKFWTRFDQFL